MNYIVHMGTFQNTIRGVDHFDVIAGILYFYDKDGDCFSVIKEWTHIDLICVGENPYEEGEDE
jgi:hypothetical protein